MRHMAAILALFGLMLTPQEATAACSCAEPQLRPREALSRSIFAVLARVTAVRAIDSFVDSTTSSPNPSTLEREIFRFYRYEMTLVVERRFKGTPGDTIHVVTEFDSCTYFGPYEPPDLGKQHFLVFYQDREAIPLRVRDCGGSAPWEVVEPSEREALMKFGMRTEAPESGPSDCRAPAHRSPDAPTIHGPLEPIHAGDEKREEGAGAGEAGDHASVIYQRVLSATDAALVTAEGRSLVAQDSGWID